MSDPDWEGRVQAQVSGLPSLPPASSTCVAFAFRTCLQHPRPPPRLLLTPPAPQRPGLRHAVPASGGGRALAVVPPLPAARRHTGRRHGPGCATGKGWGPGCLPRHAEHAGSTPKWCMGLICAGRCSWLACAVLQCPCVRCAIQPVGMHPSACPAGKTIQCAAFLAGLIESRLIQRALSEHARV